MALPRQQPGGSTQSSAGVAGWAANDGQMQGHCASTCTYVDGQSAARAGATESACATTTITAGSVTCSKSNTNNSATYYGG